MKINWNGKIAIVTGASGGIGAAIAEKLASQGLVVILVARRLNKLEELAQKINKAGGIAYPYQADLTSSTQRIGLVDQICRKFGTPSILINNAGLGWYGYFYQMPWPVAKELISLNIESTTHLTSLLISKMQTLDAARIINIRSIAGKLPEQGIAVYSASKAYLDAFSTATFRDLRDTNVTLSVLRAGPVKTDFFDHASELQNGGRVPAESLAIYPDRVAEGTWRLIRHPHRVLYVPFYLVISPLLETFFSWALDWVGPILLRNQNTIRPE